MLQDHPLWHRFTARLHLLVAMLVSLVGAVIFGLSAGEGDFRPVLVVLGVFFMLTVFSLLGSRYWLVIPFAFVSQLAAIPVGGKVLELPEVVTFVCLLYFLIQYALRKQKFTLFRLSHVPVQLFTAWAVVIFLQNPVGLSELGSELGGLRFYAKIGLALIAFLLLANQEIGERECKWCFVVIFAATALSSCQEIYFVFRPQADGNVIRLVDTDNYYSWQQALAGMPTLIILYLLSRYRSSQIFSIQRIWLLAVFVGSIVMILLSGKRAALASIPFFAGLAALVRKEFGYVFFWLAGAAIACVVVIAGHNEIFHLPLTVQRALSVLPANWDSEIQSFQGGKDEFRDMLRVLAREKIHHDPWIGTGYRVDRRLMEMALMQSGGGIEGQVMPYALGSAWHNTWLGYAADFGIPASIFVGIIYLTVLVRAWKTYRQCPPNSFSQALSLYILLFTARDVLVSHTSGHSSLDAYGRWWMFGLLVSLSLTNRARQPTQQEAKVLAGPKSVLAPALLAQPARLPATVPRPSRF